MLLFPNVVFSNNGGCPCIRAWVAGLGKQESQKEVFSKKIKVTTLELWVRMTDLNTCTLLSLPKNLTVTVRFFKGKNPRIGENRGADKSNEIRIRKLD